MLSMFVVVMVALAPCTSYCYF